MTEAEFRSKRRQKFLTEKYFKLNQEWLQLLISDAPASISRRTSEGKRDAVVEGGVYKDKLKLLRLHYTAGESIDSLMPLLFDTLKWFEEWHRAYRAQIAALAIERDEELRTDGTPCRFDDMFHFQLALDMVSLGTLFGAPEVIRHVAAWVERYRHTDMLFEYLIERMVSDPDTTIAKFFHKHPYDPLLDAVFTAKTPEAASAFVKQYLDGWYKAFKGVPWHDGHLEKSEHQMPYEGYWAFDAAAVCVLHGIDDSSFRDHLVYPKDLADWARANRSLDKIKPSAGAASAGDTGLRCEGGQPCPRSGFWFTPAKPDSRRHFEQGQVLPSVGGDFGTTIWQWDEHKQTS